MSERIEWALNLFVHHTLATWAIVVLTSIHQDGLFGLTISITRKCCLSYGSDLCGTWGQVTLSWVHIPAPPLAKNVFFRLTSWLSSFFQQVLSNCSHWLLVAGFESQNIDLSHPISIDMNMKFLYHLVSVKFGHFDQKCVSWKHLTNILELKCLLQF